MPWNSSWRKRVLEDFQQWLEAQPETPAPSTRPASEECDLHTLFSELAALRQEIRLQSREQARLARELTQAGERYDTAAGVSGQREEELSAFEERIRRDAERACVLSFLEVRDALVRGRDAAVKLAAPRDLQRPTWPGVEAIVEGYEMIVERFDRALASSGVEVLHSVGEPFDGRWMHALQTREVEGTADQQVVDELRCGFTWNGEVLRVAEVVVNRTARTDDTRGDQ